MWEFENLLVRTGEAEGKWLDISSALQDKINREPTAELAAVMLSKRDGTPSARTQTVLTNRPKLRACALGV
jgi:hypothetical protein